MNLFDRVMKFKVRGTRQIFIPKNKVDTLYGYLILIKHYILTIIPTSTWGDKVIDLLQNYQNQYPLSLKYWSIDEIYKL